MDFPDETESKMIQLVSRAEKAEARVAELEALLPSALKAKLESAEARVAELEAKHPEWMKRIQRERLEERERCIQFFFGMVHSHKDSPQLRENIREALK